MSSSLVELAREFSPRLERHRDDLVSVDVGGLGHLFGHPRAIGEELQRQAAVHGLHVHVAIAGTHTAAMLLALARPGLTLVEPGKEAGALALVSIGILAPVAEVFQATSSLHPSREAESLRSRLRASEAERARGGAAFAEASAARRSLGGGWGGPREVRTADGTSELAVVSAFKRWGIRTLGELAALPPVDLAARLGQQGLVWQAIARGEDVRPLVPTLPEEPFEASTDLEWPIEGIEPVSFVLTRLLEPLSARLDRRDRGAAVLHVRLRLVTREIHARSLQLPLPIRDARTLRTLALLDLEGHPPRAAVDQITVAIDPTPSRMLQHTLFTRAQPAPEQLSTLLARLTALMGEDRVGVPVAVDSYRPGAFAIAPAARASIASLRAAQRERAGVGPREQKEAPAARASRRGPQRGSRAGVPIASLLPTRSGPTPTAAVLRVRARQRPRALCSRGPQALPQPLVSALRRYRHPVPACVAVVADRPVRVTTDRPGVAGGRVVACRGPWRTSGEWWSACGHARTQAREASASGGSREPVSVELHAREQSSPRESNKSRDGSWDRDEWDVALGDGAVCRVFRDRNTKGWFIDAVFD